MRLSAVGTIVIALLVASCGQNMTLPQPPAESTGENVALLQEAKTGDTAGIIRSLAAGADPNYVPSGGVSEAYHLSEYGETPLINAARGGHLPAVRLLLHRGARPNVRTYDDTPLHAAAIRGHVDIVKLLLEWGANVNARVGIGTGEDALRGALVRGQANAVAVLYAEGAAIEPSYLCYAVSDGKEAMVSLLLSIGLDPKSIDCRGRSAFDIARALTTPDREKILRRLAAGAWPNMKPVR
jgi:ankyrin repeat protein